MKKKYLPFIAAVALFLTITLTFLSASVMNNQGRFIYAGDDVYIHMAMAKHFVQHGIWGVTPFEFSSCSSSPLYTLLLSLIFFVFGVSESASLIINILFGVLLIYWLNFVFQHYAPHPVIITALLCGFVLLAPLPSLSVVFSGLEHTLHIFLTLVVTYLAGCVLATRNIKSKEAFLLPVLAPLITSTRYEGLFLMFVIGCLLLIRRQVLYAILMGIVALLPVVLYGLLTQSKGWYFLPNSVVLKGNTPHIANLSDVVNFMFFTVMQIGQNPHVLLLILGGLIALYFSIGREKTVWAESNMMVIVFLGTALLHMQFAKVVWLERVNTYTRYDAYLVVLGLFVLCVPVLKYLQDKRDVNKSDIGKLWSRAVNSRSHLKFQHSVLAIIIIFIAVPFTLRASRVLKSTVQGTTNIYEQQYQMAMFVKDFYQGVSIGANDIGAINYFADIRCLDLFGLASMDVAATKRTGVYDTEAIYEIAKQHDVRIAIVYDKWFDINGGLPPQWVKVGQWTIKDNRIVGGDTVTFYAVDTNEAAALAANLQQFTARLPTDVTARIFSSN